MSDISSFLNGIFGEGSAGAAGTMGLNLLGSYLSGGMKGRPQWGDLKFMNDATNRLWPDEIKRQGQFLEGVAPSQAAAYNTYQDATYGQDTSRQVDRIKTMGSELGMSPWELTGAGGANPLPSPGAAGSQQGQDKTSAFLQGIMPLQLAKMQIGASLLQTKMNNETSLKISGQQTAGGKVAEGQVALQAAQQALTDQNLTESLARTSQINASTDQTQVQTVLNMVNTLATIAPKVRVSMGPYEATGLGDSSPLLQLSRELINTGPGERDEKVKAYMNSMPQNMLDQMATDLKTVGKYVREHAEDFGASLGDSTAKGFMGFLKGLGSNFQ